MRSISFDGLTLAAELTRAGTVVHLEPKQLAVLRALLERRHRRVTVDELRALVWRRTRVAASSVHVAISALRKTIAPVLISGKQGVGYQIHAEVTADSPPTIAQLTSPAAWRYYAAHATGSAAERAAMADELAAEEAQRFDR